MKAMPRSFVASCAAQHDLVPTQQPEENAARQSLQGLPLGVDPYTENAWGSYQIWFDSEDPNNSVGVPLARVGAFFLRLRGPYLVARIHAPEPGRVRSLIVDTVGGPLSPLARLNPLPDWEEFQALVDDLPGMHVIIRPILSDSTTWDVSKNNGRYFSQQQIPTPEETP